MFCGLDTPSVQTWPVGPGVNLTPVVYLSTVLLSKAFYSLFLTVAYFSQSHIFSTSLGYLEFCQENTMVLEVIHKFKSLMTET